MFMLRAFPEITGGCALSESRDLNRLCPGVGQPPAFCP
jgi:hypothetical protein